MANKVEFTGAELLQFSRNHKGGKARFQFAFTQKAAAAMGWGELGDFQAGTNLDGDLAASIVELYPNEPELKRHQTRLKTSRVHNFIATRQELEGKRGKGHKWVVQCDVEFPDEQGCRILEAYMQTCGKSSLRIAYTEQPKQEDLPGVEKDDKQSKLEVQ